jgi:hypothetical protein
MISGTAESSGVFKNCTRFGAWNGYGCQNENLGILLFESNDADNMTRIISPIIITGFNTSSRNVLNTFMNHHWDDLYTSLQRPSRFPSLIEGGKNMYYNITCTGVQPNKQRFSLSSVDTSIIISIKYNHAQVFQVRDYTKEIVKGNDWDSSIGAPAFLKGNVARIDT